MTKLDNHSVILFQGKANCCQNHVQLPLMVMMGMNWSYYRHIWHIWCLIDYIDNNLLDTLFY